MYQGIKRERRGYNPKQIFFKNKQGQIIGGDKQIRERWKEYFEELLHGKNEEEVKDEYREEDKNNGIQDTEDPPTIEEVRKTTKNLKNNMSPGMDQINPELFKHGGDELTKWMHTVIKKIWTQEKIPKGWNEAALVPIYKKGEKTECANYRGIALLNVAYKILTTELKKKLANKIEGQIEGYQCGFRKGRSVVDQIYALKEIQAESYEYQKETHVLFIDFKQAYDRVKRKNLFGALEELGVKGKILDTPGNRKQGQSQGGFSEKFRVKEGLRQGDPLSALLFICALEYVIRKAELNRSGLVYHKKHQCLVFADDLAIITRNKRQLQEVTMKLEKEAREMGLEINEEKTKYMGWTEENLNKQGELRIVTERGKEYRFKEAERFIYLGVEFSRQPESRTEIQRRIPAGNQCVYGLKKLLHSKEVGINLKVKIYKTIIKPIVIYGSEVWTLGTTSQEESMLKVWERKILRKIYGGKKIHDCWERSNREVLELHKEAVLSADIQDSQEEKNRGPQHLEPDEDESAASFASAGSGCAESVDGFEDLPVSEKTVLEQDQNQDEIKPNQYQCTACGQNYSKEKQLKQHEQSHTDNLQFTCAYCPRLFKHKRSRDRHTKLHTGDKKYKCQQCESAFSRSDHLKIHMKTHDSRKPYKCGTCNRGYNTAAALSSHQQTHLKQESRCGSRTSEESTPSPSFFRCIHCTESFGKPDQLQSHVTTVHSDSDSSLSQTPEPLPEHSNRIDELKIVCMYCSKEFPTMDSMYQHTNSTHCDVPNGVPSSVSTSSPTVQGSTKQENYHNGTPNYFCDRCTLPLDSSQNLKNHINNYHWHPTSSPNPVKDLETFLSDEKSFSPFQTQPTDLSRKKKNEENCDKIIKRKKSNSPTTSPYGSNDKPCICSCCYAQLPNFKSFLKHMESHVISSNNSLLGFCPVCGEPGRDPVSFTNHIFSHAIAQVPGRCCYSCKRTFERQDELQKHLLDAHVVSIYKCSLCNNIFDTKISMQLHLSNKHSDECKHFKCYLCTNQVFHDKLSAELHISMKHFQQFTPCAGSANHSFFLSQYQTDLDSKFRDYGFNYQCNYCRSTFKDQYSQYIHVLKEHNETKEGENFIVDSTMNQNPSKSPNFVFPKIVTPDHVSNDCTHACDICNCNDITSETDLINHKKIHHNKNKIGPVSLQCAYCNEYCKSRNDLENHMKTHQVSCGKGKHKCNICDEIYSSTLTLADHKLTHCKIVEGNSCVQCKSVLNDEQSFYNHQQQHSNNPTKPNSQITLPANCIICCQTLQTEVEIKLHAKFHLKHLSKKDCICRICNKIFDSQSGYTVNSYENSSNNVSIFLCKDCNAKSINGSSNTELDIKNNSTPGNQFNCIHCPQTFESEIDIQNHNNMHMLKEGTNVECRLCKQVFTSPLKLQTHLIEHNFYGMNQYTCYVCSSVFTAASGLQNHIVGHGLESRPYECSQCQLKFFFRAELDNHRFVHILRTPTNIHNSYPVLDNVDMYEDISSSHYKVCKYCSNSYLDNPFFVEHLKQCPFKRSPNHEVFDTNTTTNNTDNNIKMVKTENPSDGITEKDEQ